MILKRFLYNSSLILLITTLFSCINKQSTINEEFEKQFSQEVERINRERQQQEDQQNQPTESSQTPQQNNPYQTQRYHLPDDKVFSAGQASLAGFPNDIFEIKYFTQVHGAFRQTGFEFDTIEIPQYDAFGVPSDLRKKQYMLVGDDVIQHNIDKLNAAQNEEAVELSDILIRENKMLRQQKKYNEIFGDDEMIAKKEQELSEEEKAETEFLAAKKAKRNDPLRRMIASQILQQNLRANAPKTQQQGSMNNQQ